MLQRDFLFGDHVTTCHAEVPGALVRDEVVDAALVGNVLVFAEVSGARTVRRWPTACRPISI
jgi:hypothetical protein